MFPFVTVAGNILSEYTQLQIPYIFFLPTIGLPPTSSFLPEYLHFGHRLGTEDQE